MPVPPSRAGAIRRRLLAWWDAGHRDLPWRSRAGETPDPYRVWISEVMLQQTRVEAAAPYFARFVARFPDLAALAGAEVDDVLALWSGLGYYARARNLHRAARVALARHGGLPAAAEDLRALPGFGPYTAGAVASLAFGAREAAVDGNAARVLSRLFAVDAPPQRAATRQTLAALAGSLVPPRRPGDFNAALMDLGATVCRKPVPSCSRCPLSRLCEARRARRERELPPPRRRAAQPRVAIVCAVVWRGDRLLLERRRDSGLFGGLWELPSAEVQAGADRRESLRAALALRGLEVRPGRRVASVERVLTHRRLSIHAYRCALAAPAALPGSRFVAPGAVDALGVSTAMRRVVEAARAAG